MNPLKETLTEFIAVGENRERVKEWIGAPSYRLDFRKALEKRYGTTCEWILKQDKYRLWAAAEHSAFLVIYGKAGCGKLFSALFSSIA